MLAGLAACAPGPPPTPTVPPQLDRTVTPTTPTATASSTATTTATPAATATIPSKTPTLAPIFTAPPTYTLLPAVLASPTGSTLPTIPPPSAAPPAQPPALPVGPAAVAANPEPPVIANPAASAGGSPGSYRPAYISGQSSPLPVPAVANPASLPAVPQNSDFDDGAYEQGAQEVRVPQGWTAWWRTGPVDCQLYAALPTDGPCPALQDPGLVYRRPEFTVIYSTDPAFTDPPRVYGPGWAARFFCTYGICTGGYLQRVRVTPGQRYVLAGMVQSWCSTETDRTRSETATHDGRLNCELALGLDPTGGADPFSPAIIWQAVNAYDSYVSLATPPVVAQGQVMTLYLRGRSLWGFLHNDFHFDQVRFLPG